MARPSRHAGTRDCRSRPAACSRRSGPDNAAPALESGVPFLARERAGNARPKPPVRGACLRARVRSRPGMFRRLVRSVTGAGLRFDVDPHRCLCARVLRGYRDSRRGSRSQNHAVRTHPGTAQDPDHAGAGHSRWRRGPHGARGRAVREPVQGIEVDMVVRLGLPRCAPRRAHRAPAVFHRAGVGVGRLRPRGSRRTRGSR